MEIQRLRVATALPVDSQKTRSSGVPGRELPAGGPGGGRRAAPPERFQTTTWDGRQR